MYVIPRQKPPFGGFLDFGIRLANIEEQITIKTKEPYMYSIAGFGKVKTIAEFAAIAAHNMRIKMGQGDIDRIDRDRIVLNEILINDLNVNTKSIPDLGKKFFEYYEKKQVEIKKDSVLAIDLVLTASPEFFGDWHQNGKITPEGRKKIDDWKKVQIEFAKTQFGADAVKFAVLHLDETTPHIHLLISPEEKKMTAYKNQYVTKNIERVSLNAKRWNPKFWTSFVTAHAKANEKFGLKRGDELSLAKNITIKEFKRRIKMATNTDFEKVINNLMNDFVDSLAIFTTPKKVKEQFNKVFRPALTKMIKSNKALKVAQEKTLEERDQLKIIKEAFEKKLAEYESKEKSQNARFTEIDKLRNANKQLTKANQDLTLQNEELLKKIPTPKVAANQFTFQKKA